MISKVLIKDKIKLEPKLVRKNYGEELLKKLRAKNEGKCTKHGYICENSIEIFKVAPGVIEIASLSGMVIYDVYFYANICNPVVGSVVKGVVKNTNRFGVLVDAPPVLDIIIPKNSVDIISEINLEEVKIDQEITIEIIGRKYELNDKRITVVGRALAEFKPAPQPAAVVLNEESEDDEPEAEEEIVNEEQEEEQDEDPDAEEPDEQEDNDSIAGGSANEFDIFNEEEGEGDEYEVFNSSGSESEAESI